jgi:hypothetical protein
MPSRQVAAFLARLTLAVTICALATCAFTAATIGTVAGVQDAHATHPCDTTPYWNVSWCLYHPNQGRTKVRQCCTLTQSAYNQTTGICIRFLHITGDGSWLSAPHVCSGGSWTFYDVASTDKIGCFHWQDNVGNEWINCRRANTS